MHLTHRRRGRCGDMRRQALEEELQRTKPPTNPDLDRAAAILEDFARFWDAEPKPAERRKLILSLFEQVWQKDGQIVAVKPNHAFASYFTAATEAHARHPKADAGDEATKAGATGLLPGLSTPVRGRRYRSLAGAAVGCPAVAREQFAPAGNLIVLQSDVSRPFRAVASCGPWL